MESAPTEPVKGSPSFLAPGSMITLSLGLLSIAVSLYIFYASRARPSLTIEQLPSISYAATQKLTGLGTVTLTVNGRAISELRAIPFLISNTGNVPISSIQQGVNYNLVGPLTLVLRDDAQPNVTVRTVGIQVDGSSSSLACSFGLTPDVTTVVAQMRSLNPSSQCSFTVLYEGESELTASLVDNPLLGGDILVVVRGAEAKAVSIWARVKSLWLAQIMGVLLLAQFPMVLIALAVGARRLRRKTSQDARWTEIEGSPEMVKATEHTKQAVEAELLAITSSISAECQEKMKAELVQVPLSGGLFDEGKTAALAVFEVFKDGLADKWKWVLEKKHPQPREFDRYGNIEDLIISPWYDWEEFVKGGVLLWGLPSICLGALGYGLLFL